MVSWVAAVLCSLCQWFIWGTTELAPGWEQCLTIWDQRRFELQKSAPLYSQDPLDGARRRSETVYMVAHLLTVFWLPFTMVAGCYVIMCVKILRLSCTPYTSVPQRGSEQGMNNGMPVNIVNG